ncbi:hypothetical protein GCM10027188_17120 [Lysobacter humi (ex Lee et al. 2017)]
MAAESPPLVELLDLMPDAVCVVDPDGVLLYASAAFERMLGYPRAALLGTRCSTSSTPTTATPRASRRRG